MKFEFVVVNVEQCGRCRETCHLDLRTHAGIPPGDPGDLVRQHVERIRQGDNQWGSLQSPLFSGIPVGSTVTVEIAPPAA